MSKTNQKKMNYRTFELKIDDADSKGMIRGFASTFGNVDLGYDVVDKGAFVKSIEDSSGGRWPILKNHDFNQHIGYNGRAQETDQGLFVEGKINLNTQLGKETYEMIKQSVEFEVPMGLSIGYYTIKAEDDFDNPRIRRLKELKVFEYSVTAFPMNEQASITDVKKADVEFLLLQAEKMGLSKKDILKTLQGIEAVSNPDSNDPNLDVQSMEKKIDFMLSEMKTMMGN